MSRTVHKTISNELDEAALSADLATMKTLIGASTAFDPREEAFDLLLVQSARDVELFRAVINKTNFASVSNEKKSGIFSGNNQSGQS